MLQATINIWGVLSAHQVPNPKPTAHTCLQETRCFDALAELYSDLSEDDILYGLWKRRCIHEGTRAGLSLVQHGYLEQAQDVFLDSMKIDPKAPAPNGQPKGSSVIASVTLGCSFSRTAWCSSDVARLE